MCVCVYVSVRVLKHLQAYLELGAESRSEAISLGVQGEAGITGEQVKAVKPTAEQRDS